MLLVIYWIYVYFMVGIVLLIVVMFFYYGIFYYFISLEEWFYYIVYDYFKFSGIFGYGLGILGILFIFIGVILYIF